jgi:hypothetical protein
LITSWYGSAGIACHCGVRVVSLLFIVISYNLSVQASFISLFCVVTW